MKLEELVSMCSVCQRFVVRDYAQSGKVIYSGQLGIDDSICKLEMRLVTAQDSLLVVHVDKED